MRHPISIGSFVLIGASTLAYIVYRRCNPTPHCAKTPATMNGQQHSRSCTTKAYTPHHYHTNWTAWQLHASISIYLNTPSYLTTKQQRRLEFIAFLMETGRLTEFMNVPEVERSLT